MIRGANHRSVQLTVFSVQRKTRAQTSSLNTENLTLNTPMHYLTPILLLIASNVFMTIAWYGHLKHQNQPLLLVIFVSWGIALFEYSLMIPANRMGDRVYSVTQLKVIQEAITMFVFVGFAWLYFGVTPNWRTALAVLFVIAAVLIVPRKEAEI
jgi:uncharacterized protein